MGLFNQFANVVEWEPANENILFWKWKNDEIKKGSRLIVRPGQDAVFLYNGRVEGIFRDEGSYDIESQIIPFLSTLKGFKFGFNSGLRAEVMFINTREITEKWGTKNAINIPAPGLPGGMPIRSFGTFSCKVSDEQVLTDKVAGVQDVFTMEDIKSRVMSKLDQLLMKHIATEGKDMFHLQAYAGDIARGIQGDLDYELVKIGITVTDFAISSVSYPDEIQKMAEKAASQSMVSDVNKYTQMAMADALGTGGNSAAGASAANMAGIGMGMAMGQQMAGQMMQSQMGAGMAPQNPQAAQGLAAGAKFCSNCGSPLDPGAKFCSNCGTKLQ